MKPKTIPKGRCKMTTKHTPGPWKFSETMTNGFEIYGQSPDDLDAIAKTYDSNVEGREKANAHLIEAAPDLLKAVDMALELLSRHARYEARYENRVCTVNHDLALHVFGNLKYAYHKANGTIEEMERKGELLR